MKATGREPQNIRASDWYYEYPSHLLIVHEVRDAAGLYIQTDQFKLPWKMIDRSRKRRSKLLRRKIVHKPKNGV